jgi:putative transposase
LITRVCDWPHPSFRRDARAGLFPEDWAGLSAEGSFGERA